VVVISTIAAPAPSATELLQAPRIRVKQGTSLNWAGYAVETNLNTPQNDAVTDVAGTWTVPSVTATGTTNAYSSIWVGIDGYDSNTVEQIGTEQDIINGLPVYSAWYEMYPKYPFNLNKRTYPVNPGDQITARVQYGNKGTFTLTMTNKGTTGKTIKWTYSTTQKSPSARRSSAEWIVEAPWSSGVLPLSNFGTATFTNASVKLNGTAGTIGSWPYDPMDMVTSSGALKAQTFALSSDGTSFSVQWLSN
jgi:hypothetical protein